MRQPAAPVSSPLPTVWDDEVRQRHARHNFAVLAFDGGFYQAAMALLAVETLLPTLVHQLGGADWLVALAPSLYQYGFLVIPVLVTGWTERMVRYKPIIAWTSVPQRLPPLLAGLALLFLHESHPRLTLWTVALAPLTMSLCGGFNVAAFWQFFAKVVPPNRLSSNMGVRNIVGTVLGFLVASAGATVLATRPGFEGPGLLYVGSFGFMMLSLWFLTRARELPHAPHEPSVSAVPLAERLRRLPSQWRTDPILRHYTLARVGNAGLGIFTPFLAIRALAVLGKPESFVGRFVAAQMFGSIVGNLLSAWLGDRRGGRSVALVGGWLSLALCVAAPFNRSELGFYAIFAVFGMVTFLNVNGAFALVLELFPAARRPSCLALSSLVLAPAMLTAALAGGWLRELTGTLQAGAALAAGLGLLSLWYFHRLPATPTPR